MTVTLLKFIKFHHEPGDEKIYAHSMQSGSFPIAGSRIYKIEINCRCGEIDLNIFAGTRRPLAHDAKSDNEYQRDQKIKKFRSHRQRKYQRLIVAISPTAIREIMENYASKRFPRANQGRKTLPVEFDARWTG